MIISENKKVSVVIPNYNYEKFIERRIDSIIKQTYPVYELIVLDDASTDKSAELIERKLADVREKHPEIQIKFLKNEENSGKVMAQWKKGFDEATGDFVWIAEADDLCSKRFLEEVMKGFSDPEVVLSYTESKLINGAGLVIAPNFRWSRDREKTGHYKKSYIRNGFREIEEIMAIRCTIPNVSAVVFRKAARIPYTDILDEALRFSQVGDWYFYVKVLSCGKISYNHRALNKFRVHQGSKTSGAKKDINHFREILWMHKMLAIKYNLNEFVTRRMVAEEMRVAKKMGIDNKKLEKINRELTESGIA